MAGSKIEIFVHFVWTTAGRQPLITTAIRRRVYRSIQGEVRRMGARVLALNGIADHVHLLAALPATVAVDELMQRAKGVSSHVGRKAQRDEAPFSWQYGYGCFSISTCDVPNVIDYILNQERHHARGEDLVAAWEQTEQPAAGHLIPAEERGL